MRLMFRHKIREGPYKVLDYNFYCHFITMNYNNNLTIFTSYEHKYIINFNQNQVIFEYSNN